MLWNQTGALQQYYGQPNTDATRTPQNSDITWIVFENRPVSSAIVSCSYLFVATFATTWGPVSWTYPAEIYPSKIRAKAVSLSTAANWFWNMVLAFAVPPLLWNISYNMYYIFGAFNAAALVHMFLFAHETKGFTLEEMDDVFDSGKWAWKKYERKSRLEDIERQIAEGNMKVRWLPFFHFCLAFVVPHPSPAQHGSCSRPGPTDSCANVTLTRWLPP